MGPARLGAGKLEERRGFRIWGSPLANGRSAGTQGELWVLRGEHSKQSVAGGTE